MSEHETNPKEELDRKVHGLQIVGGLTDEEVEAAKVRGRKRAEEIRKQVRQMPSPLYPEGRPEDDDTTQT